MFVLIFTGYSAPLYIQRITENCTMSTHNVKLAATFATRLDALNYLAESPDHRYDYHPFPLGWLLVEK